MNEIPAYKISASIVFYKENLMDLSRAVNSFLACPFSKKLFLIDNSPTNEFEKVFNHPDISYVFVGTNIGFGAGHNLVLEKFTLQSDFHLILNPDVGFESTIFDSLVGQFRATQNLGLVAPKVIYPRGDLQYTARRYPTPVELILRTLPVLRAVFKKTIAKGQYMDKNLSQSFEPDVLHGCFLLFKTNVFIKLKGFDQRYFLYMEDVDICRKLDDLKFKKCYFPMVTIEHHYRRASKKQAKLFFVHLQSAYKYYFKWGFTSKKR